jgi:hypothetical protein
MVEYFMIVSYNLQELIECIEKQACRIMQSSNNISYIKQGLKIPMVKSENVLWRADNA